MDTDNGMGKAWGEAGVGAKEGENGRLLVQSAIAELHWRAKTGS